MSADLTPMEQSLLQRISVGDLDVEHASVREQMAASTTFRREVEEWMRVFDTLEGARRAQEAELARARALATDEDRHLIRAALEPRLPPRRRRRGWVFAALLTAAGVLLLLGLQRGWLAARAPRADGFLGAEEAAAPVGASATLARFAIDVALEAHETMLFVIYDAAGTEILRSPALKTPTWQLSPEQLARLTGPILWAYEIRAASGSARFGGPYRAWLAR